MKIKNQNKAVYQKFKKTGSKVCNNYISGENYFTDTGKVVCKATYLKIN